MAQVRVLLSPVSFVLESGMPRFVTLAGEDGSPLTTEVTDDAEQSARHLLRDTVDSLCGLNQADRQADNCHELLDRSDHILTLAGAATRGPEVKLVYTTLVPVPLAEAQLDVAEGSPFRWRTISQSRGRHSSHSAPERRTGPDAIVLDYWRQAFEESDMALDFLPEYLSLLQLRSLYDAVWGYSQDPSGFKRWAIDRTGAFRGLLEEVTDPTAVDESFFSSLGHRLSPEVAALAGAVAVGGLTGPVAPALRLPIALAAAAAANRLHHRRGPEPTWFRKTPAWRPGPTWIQHLYPPRPNWTRWDVERS